MSIEQIAVESVVDPTGQLTSKMIYLVEKGLIDPEALACKLLKYMGESEVKEFVLKNGLGEEEE